MTSAERELKRRIDALARFQQAHFEYIEHELSYALGGMWFVVIVAFVLGYLLGRAL